MWAGGGSPLLAKSMLVTFGLGAFPRVLEAEFGTRLPLRGGPAPLGCGKMGPFNVSMYDFLRSAFEVRLSKTFVRRSFNASKVTWKWSPPKIRACLSGAKYKKTSLIKLA